MKYRLGTRKSALATTQSRSVLADLKKAGVECELVFIESEGDVDRKRALYEIESSGPGLFTKQLETALLQGQIDLAVHSLKDLPTDQPQGLVVAAIPKRVMTADHLILNPAALDPTLPLSLKKGARVGTSSLRREAQLLSVRPDLEVFPIRGNVPTRVEAVRLQKCDAVVLAGAGLFRLNLACENLHNIELPEDRFISAPGQGALAIETRDDADLALRKGLAALHDLNSAEEVEIERSILKELHGGCTLPLGVRCQKKAQGYFVQAFLGISEGEPRRWTHFEHFDFTDSNSQNCVSMVAKHFRNFHGRSK